MLYKLSKIIPVRMKSEYKERGRKYTHTWWQWRDHIWASKKTRVS